MQQKTLFAVSAKCRQQELKEVLCIMPAAESIIFGGFLSGANRGEFAYVDQNTLDEFREYLSLQDEVNGSNKKFIGSHVNHGWNLCLYARLEIPTRNFYQEPAYNIVYDYTVIPTTEALEHFLRIVDTIPIEAPDDKDTSSQR